MTMTNLSMEMGVKCAFFSPDDKTIEYLKGRLKDQSRYHPVLADPDAEYEQELAVDIAQLEPMVACPHEVQNTKRVGEVAGTHIDQVFLGSCANAKYEDLVVAAEILKGHRIHPGLRMIITPGSKKIMLEAMNSGVLQTLMESGGLVTNPGCGACAGDGGMLADGEVCLSTANRNFIGRMGSSKSLIYLSSPATLAASAIKGVIADPREFMN
jgi:3-isopropylmalate/(R)-2-methylmalate dehydratase large subunit